MGVAVVLLALVLLLLLAPWLRLRSRQAPWRRSGLGSRRLGPPMVVSVAAIMVSVSPMVSVSVSVTMMTATMVAMVAMMIATVVSPLMVSVTQVSPPMVSVSQVWSVAMMALVPTLPRHQLVPAPPML